MANTVPLTCQWFALCENEATMSVPHPAFVGGVPTCERCATKLELTGTPLTAKEQS